MAKKDFVVKVYFVNGYSHKTVSASNFGEACSKIFKEEAKRFNYPDGFKNVTPNPSAPEPIK